MRSTRLRATGPGRRAGVPARRARDPRGGRGAAQASSARSTEILPLFARLSAQEQERVFKAHAGRRIVLATNVAETSLTVPGIRYVIDPGLARVKRYSYRNKVELLQVETISQAAAKQRAGRCGRVAERRLHPAVRRGGLRQAARIHRSGDPALLARRGDPAHEGAGARRGRGFSRSSTRPHRARSRTATRCCTSWARSTSATSSPTSAAAGEAAARSARRPHAGRRARGGMPRRGAGHRRGAVGAGPARAAAGARAGRRRGAHAVRRRALGLPRPTSSSGNSSRKACSTNPAASCTRPAARHFLSFTRMREWRDVHAQLQELAAGARLESWRYPAGQPASYARVHRALLTGLLGNVGMKADDGNYHRRARHQVLGASRARRSARRRRRWIMAAELIETTRLYARSVASDRARMARGARRAPAQAPPDRSALGEEAARRWWRSSAARSTGCRCTRTGACTTGRSIRRRRGRSSSARRWWRATSRRARRSSRTTGAWCARSSTSSTSRAARTSWSTTS